MTRVVRWAIAGFLLGVLSVAAWTYVSFHQSYKGYGTTEQFVEIPAGSGTTSMGRRLADAGVIRSASSFRVAVWIRGAGRRLQAGEYRFTEPMTLAQVVDKIARGDVYVRSITFREGLTVREMADMYQSAGFGTADVSPPSQYESPGSGRDQPQLDGLLNQLRIAFHTEQFHDPVFVEFNGARADRKQRRHLFHRLPLGKQLQHLALT